MAFIIEICVLVLRSFCRLVYAAFRKYFPLAEKSVRNEIVLITGAGRGIGKELALQYAALGATVVCWGVSKDKNLATVDEIARFGYPKAYFYECDVGDHNMVMQTAQKVQQEVGDVTILVNNAGVAFAKLLLQQTREEIKSCLDINLMSHFWTIQAFLPAMLKNNYGHIVSNNSMCGLVGGKNGLSYCASKFGNRGLMEALYHELRMDPECQIKLTIVYPTLVNTNIFKKVSTRYPRLMPILEPQDVAKQIISAQRRNIFELVIPEQLNILGILYTSVPVTVRELIYDFMDIRFDS